LDFQGHAGFALNDKGELAIGPNRILKIGARVESACFKHPLHKSGRRLLTSTSALTRTRAPIFQIRLDQMANFLYRSNEPGMPLEIQKTTNPGDQIWSSLVFVTNDSGTFRLPYKRHLRPILLSSSIGALNQAIYEPPNEASISLVAADVRRLHSLSTQGSHSSNCSSSCAHRSSCSVTPACPFCCAAKGRKTFVSRICVKSFVHNCVCRGQRWKNPLRPKSSAVYQSNDLSSTGARRV